MQTVFSFTVYCMIFSSLQLLATSDKFINSLIWPLFSGILSEEFSFVILFFHRNDSIKIDQNWLNNTLNSKRKKWKTENVQYGFNIKLKQFLKSLLTFIQIKTVLKTTKNISPHESPALFTTFHALPPFSLWLTLVIIFSRHISPYFECISLYICVYRCQCQTLPCTQIARASTFFHVF